MFFPTDFRVLIVDDRPDAADSLADVVRMYGAQTRTCYDGLTAIEMIHEWPPDAAVLDVNMPGMDGCELAARLRVRCGDRRPPLLVALTGDDSDATRERTTAAGFDLHLVKAGDLSDLEGLLAKLAARALSRPNARQPLAKKGVHPTLFAFS